MSVYLGTNCVDYLKINKQKEKTVRFIDYDGETLYEYSKDAFLVLSSMPENPTGIKPLSGAIITDPGQDYFDDITDSEGKIYYDPISLDRWADYPNIVVNGEILYPTANTQTDNIVSDFLQDMYDNAGLEGTYHNETDVFVINGNSYKLITEATTTTGYLQILKTNLIPQGWNWSLSDAKAYVQEWGYLNIGQMYTTSSGDTEIDVYFSPDCTRLSPYLSLAVNGTVRILWGDSAEYTTVTGTSLTTIINTPHTYSQPGNYTITIKVDSGIFAFYSPNSTNFTLLNANASSNNDIYSSKVKNIRIGENCIIGTYAFWNCYSLQSVTIPSTVTSIGTYAFQSCYSLQSITIPDGVTSIGTYAFYNCYSLKSITIPNGVTSISTYAFYNCYSLRSLIIPNSVITISSTSVSEVVFVKIMPSLGVSFHTTGLTLTIPYGVTSIDTYAFYNCRSLQSITIPNSVTSIDSSAFKNCRSLQSITIPNSVTSIKAYAFEYCYSLQSITIPDSVTSIGTYAFSSCYSLQSITIPNGVISINQDAFHNCYSLQSVTIPNSVTSIGTYAFDYCYSLQSITIPNGVTSIGNYAFRRCYSLSSVTIPSTVTSIGNSVFNYCSGMKEYHLKPTTPPTLGTNVFSNIPSDCIIYVPKGSLSAYQSATNWSEYASYMQEENN